MCPGNLHSQYHVQIYWTSLLILFYLYVHRAEWRENPFFALSVNQGQLKPTVTSPKSKSTFISLILEVSRVCFKHNHLITILTRNIMYRFKLSLKQSKVRKGFQKVYNSSTLLKPIKSLPDTHLYVNAHKQVPTILGFSMKAIRKGLSGHKSSHIKCIIKQSFQ